MRLIRTAEILAIGSELLTPFRSDTNSLFLTGWLNERGIDVRAKAIVGDDREELAAWIRSALGRADLVITTGGLGPTEDDVTRDAVASVLKLPMEQRPELLKAIEARFASRKIPMPAINRRQAMAPRGATALANVNGTAPGLWIPNGEQVVVLLPGPPREMQAMVETEVGLLLAGRTGDRRLRRRVLKTTGSPESHVDALAAPVYARLLAGSTPVHSTILAAPGQVEVHLSASGEDVTALDAALERGVRQLADVLGAIVFSTDGRTLEEVVGAKLAEQHLRISAAESCTGGMLMGRLTNVSGSSRWVTGGVVVYDDAVKIKQLGVSAALLTHHGAVSEQVARAMAEGVRTRIGADVGVAITGIAGPTGGSPAKPVGTVVIAAAIPSTPTAVRTFSFLGDRATIRNQSVQAALDMVRRLLG